MDKKNKENEILEVEANRVKLEKENEKISSTINKNNAKLSEVKKSVRKAEVKAIKLKVLSRYSTDEDAEEIDLLNEED